MLFRNYIFLGAIIVEGRRFLYKQRVGNFMPICLPEQVWRRYKQKYPQLRALIGSAGWMGIY